MFDQEAIDLDLTFLKIWNSFFEAGRTLLGLRSLFYGEWSESTFYLFTALIYEKNMVLLLKLLGKGFGYEAQIHLNMLAYQLDYGSFWQQSIDYYLQKFSVCSQFLPQKVLDLLDDLKNQLTSQTMTEYLAKAIIANRMPTHIPLTFTIANNEDALWVKKALESGHCPYELKIVVLPYARILYQMFSSIKKLAQQNNLNHAGSACVTLQQGKDDAQSPLSWLPQEILESIYEYTVPDLSVKERKQFTKNIMAKTPLGHFALPKVIKRDHFTVIDDYEQARDEICSSEDEPQDQVMEPKQVQDYLSNISFSFFGRETIEDYTELKAEQMADVDDRDHDLDGWCTIHR